MVVALMLGIDDPWINSSWPYEKIEITPPGSFLDVQGRSTGQWDQELVCQTFGKEDAEVILTIPVMENAGDLVAWDFDVLGVFSVKSAYISSCLSRRK